MEAARPGAGAVRIACVPRVLGTNAYHRLLYDALSREGIDRVDGVGLRVRALPRRDRPVDVLHLHWPEAYYRTAGGRLRRRVLGALKVALLGVRLAVARRRGYRIAWTVHQVHPHERQTPVLERVASRVVATFAHALLVHDEATLADVRRSLGLRATMKAHVVPHGSYADAYPRRRSRDEVRGELGIAPEAHVFLAFGHVRAYKSLDTLLDAFARVRRPDAVLLVAGQVHDEAVRRSLERAAAADDRIRLRLGFVADEDVADLFGAADTAVVTRADGGTSGALVLARSLGLPVIATDAPAYRAVAGSAAQYAAAGDADAFAAAMSAASRDGAGETPGELPSWEVVARQTAHVLRRVVARGTADDRADVLLVASSGGHLLQLLALSDAWRSERRMWVVEDTSDARSLLKAEHAVLIPWLTERSVPGLLRGLALAVRTLRRHRPAVVITTGAAPAVPFAWVAFALRIKIVYVESITRIDEPSLSCRLIGRFADRVYVQWPELQASVRGARYAGAVLEAAA
jgi:glycosyltransferase involved in cell wall biosynthesis